MNECMTERMNERMQSVSWEKNVVAWEKGRRGEVTTLCDVWLGPRTFCSGSSVPAKISARKYKNQQNHISRCSVDLRSSVKVW